MSSLQLLHLWLLVTISHILTFLQASSIYNVSWLLLRVWEVEFKRFQMTSWAKLTKASSDEQKTIHCCAQVKLLHSSVYSQRRCVFCVVKRHSYYTMWRLTLCLTLFCFGSSRNARCDAKNATWNREPCVIMEKAAKAARYILPQHIVTKPHFIHFQKDVSPTCTVSFSILVKNKMFSYLYFEWFKQETEMSTIMYSTI